MPSAKKIREWKSGEELVFGLALKDLPQAADLFRPIHDGTGSVDGWVSLEVSPLLAYDAASTIKKDSELHNRANRPNLFIKIPSTREGLPAIWEAIFKGVRVNVTLSFSILPFHHQVDEHFRESAPARDERGGKL